MGAPGGGHPPKKSGSNVGLIIGLGCGGFVILLIVVGVILAAVMGDDSATASGPSTSPPKSGGQSESNPSTSSGTGQVELRDVRFFNARTGSTVHVVGELINTGTAAVALPSAKVTLFDAGKTAIASTTCGAFLVRDLQPNEKVPCFSLMTNASTWRTYRVETKGSRPFGAFRAADLKISEVNSTSPTSRFGAHKVTGKITNRSSFTAKSVTVVVGLYDAGGKIAGAGRTLVAGNNVGPGASARFTVSVFNVAAPVKRSLTKVFGYDK